ncbi:MAG TPA: hypothetical protein VIK72_06355 [Clostridiaceae bacterium]
MLKQRHFKYLTDYNNVYEMLIKNYEPNNASGNMLPAEFEYCFCHPYLDLKSMSRSGIWEYDDKIVACAHIEFKLGATYFEVADGYNYLREEMLDFSEKYLYGTKENGTRFLSVRVPQSQPKFKEFLENRNYKFVWECERYCLPLNKEFEVTLPEGFKIISVFDGVDHAKLQIAIQLGFNHKMEDIMGDHLANSLICATGPHFNAKINYVIVAPNGDYAAYGGLWYCTGGSEDFYYHLGFKKYNSYTWLYKEF